MATKAKAGRWHNWSGSVACRLREVAAPRSIEELARMVARYARDGRRIRVAGSGHSFTPVGRTYDLLLSMAVLHGITAEDEATSTVTVLGATPLNRLGADLVAHGLAQADRCDIDVQTITD